MSAFEVIGAPTRVDVVAASGSIRELARLRKRYGGDRWRKLKGVAMIRLSNGSVRLAEIHWYEAHGIGKKEIKRKRYLD